MVLHVALSVTFVNVVSSLCRPGLDIVCEASNAGTLRRVMDHIKEVPNSVSKSPAIHYQIHHLGDYILQQSMRL